MQRIHVQKLAGSQLMYRKAVQTPVRKAAYRHYKVYFVGVGKRK